MHCCRSLSLTYRLLTIIPYLVISIKYKDIPVLSRYGSFIVRINQTDYNQSKVKIGASTAYCGLNNVDISILTVSYRCSVQASDDDGSDTPDISILLTISW